MCTALAVIGGRYVSTKISVKHGALKFNVTSSPAVADVFPQ
jgi:putative Ca2+/H+ antiporter (TMEM165/GDT1 family)